jgi:WD40 repeat protein
VVRALSSHYPRPDPVCRIGPAVIACYVGSLALNGEELAVPARFTVPLVVVIGLALTGAGRNAPPAGKAARTDLLGDPLPEGIVARLGTERLLLYGANYFAFSGDGRLLAANSDRDLRLWEVASGREVWRVQIPPFQSYSSGVNPLAFSPDGKFLALGCADQSIRVWEAASGRESHRLPCRGGMTQLAFSPDGKVLASGGAAEGIHVWDPAAGRLLGTWGQMKGPRLAFSRDGKTLTATVRDGKGGQELQAATWDAARGEERGRQPLEQTPGWSGALSPEGSLFATPTPDGKAIRLIATASGKEVGRTEGEASFPAAIAFAGDGRTLTATSRDGTVRVWRAADGKLAQLITGLSSPVERVALSPDGKVLLTVHQTDQRVHLWDVAKGKELHAFPGHPGVPLAVAFSRDGQAVFTASRSPNRSMPPARVGEWSLCRWDPQTGKEARAAVRPTKGEVYHASFSPDGSRLAVIEHDGTLRLWDTAADKELRAWKVPTRESRVVVGGQVTTFALANVSEPRFTADGKALFVTHGDRALRWDTATGKELPSLKSGGNEAMTGACQPSPDGRLVVITSFRRSEWKATLFDVQTGRPLFELPMKGWPANPVAFSPDGRTLAVVDVAQVLLWEVASGRPRGRLAEPGRSFFSLAFSPDGRFLAAGGDDRAPLRLWDLTSGHDARAEWPWARVLSLAFSPDGRRLALAGHSNTALVCDVRALFTEAPAERLKLSADDRNALWGDLTGSDGTRAYRAVQRLAASGPEGAVFLKTRLKAPAETDARRVARLLKDLDDDEFEKREKATEELKGLGQRAEAALREALKNSPSAEARHRIERLLERLKPDENTSPSPELVGLRVIEALELNGGAEARAALEGLAKGTDNERLAAEAKASLARLAGR